MSIESNANRNDQQPNFVARRIGAGVLIAASVFGGLKLGGEVVEEVKEYAQSRVENGYDQSPKTTVMIEKGGALFEVAAQLNPSGDPRRMVDAIIYLNPDVPGVKENTIAPNTQLTVPVDLLDGPQVMDGDDAPHVSVDLDTGTATVKQ